MGEDMLPSLLPAFSFCKLARRNARKCPQILQSTSQIFFFKFKKREFSVFKKEVKRIQNYQEDDNEGKDEEENNDDK